MAVQYLRQLPKLQHEHCSERQQKIEWHKNKNTSTEEPGLHYRIEVYQISTGKYILFKTCAFVSSWQY